MLTPLGAMEVLQGHFDSGSASEAETSAAIAETLKQSAELVCPHTAVGIKVANEQRVAGRPMVTLATAHPAKFPAAVEAATGVYPDLPARMADLYERDERVTRVPNDLAALKDHIKGHLTA